MIFPSGKFRIMGMVDELAATCKVYELFAKLNFEFPPITLQTMTVKLKFNPVNLYSLSGLIKSQLNLEIFPALMITKYKPVSVNVFASGAVMICGVKDLSIVNEIEQDLKLII
jgi:TATA-box binding protein (TBP) (component of TFIID and TFIIIB)